MISIKSVLEDKILDEFSIRNLNHMFKEIRYQKEFGLNDFYLVGEISNNYQK